MSTLKMIDIFEEEGFSRPKQLTSREREVVRTILKDAVGTELSLTVDQQVTDYLKHKDCAFQNARIIQNDDKWLKVNVTVGLPNAMRTMEKMTTYTFKARHPHNPEPTNHDQPRY